MATSMEHGGMASITRLHTQLGARLENRLSAYVAAEAGTSSSRSTNALAAAAIGAFGLGCLLFPDSAEAQIVYTPANTPIKPVCQSFQITCVGSLQIDFNNDGIPDASLRVRTQFATTPVSGYLAAKGLGSNAGVLVAKTKSGIGFCFNSIVAAADKLGQQIGPEGKFDPNQVMASYWYGTGSFRSCGPWRKENGKYLGFKFSINGKTHYAWARFDFSTFRGTLTGYAYETAPNTAIPAGIEREAVSDLETAPGQGADSQANASESHSSPTLGLLAEGAAGLEHWRTTR